MTLVVTQVQNPETCFALRHDVFVVEQEISVELEQDEYDATAIHLLGTVNNHPVGAARIVISDQTGKIGRVCVLAQERGHGFGAELISKALDILRNTPGITRAVLGAQTDALPFYEKLGFSPYGNVFVEVEMDHQMMELRLKT